ncbi:MAG: 16S rRNA (cytosine(1402)-N(4))-methyltransferase, partial [Desulfobacteraceae bacterium 4572_88]
MSEYRHIPVMVSEVIHYLDCGPGKIYADCTLGGAGHTRAILEKIMPGGFVVAMDQDRDAIKNAEKLQKNCTLKDVHIFHDNFTHLPEALSELDIQGVDGILLDLGMSLHQITSGGRGFSFQRDEPLDMRMNVRSDIKAEDLINTLSAEALEKIFREYGEERRAKRIARKIARTRKNGAIRSSGQLAQIVCEAVPGPAFRQKIHPATRVFMALRIAVNRELERLEFFLKNAADILNPGGRLCVLSFHSLEDRIVKHYMRSMAKGCVCPPKFPQCVCNRKKTFRVLTKKARQPAETEIAENPMSRSTKLRAAEKLGIKNWESRNHTPKGLNITAQSQRSATLGIKNQETIPRRG